MQSATMLKATKDETGVLSELETQRSKRLETLLLHRGKLSAALGSAKDTQIVRHKLEHEVSVVKNFKNCAKIF